MSNLAEKGQELKRVTAKLQSLYDKLDTKQIEQNKHRGVHCRSEGCCC